MKRIVKRVLLRVCPTLFLKYRAYKTLIRDTSSFLYGTGWMESLSRGYPCRTDGSGIPWMNYGVVAFLENRLSKEMDLFEYGSGYSTAFYARIVRSVTSIEYDEVWLKTVRGSLPSNAKILFRNQDVDGEYCRAILGAEGQQYDVVVVDGRDRVNCVKQAKNRLTPSGVIVLDDSQRERYAEAFEFARTLGFAALDFEGIKATDAGFDRTTVFYRPNNCLSL